MLNLLEWGFLGFLILLIIIVLIPLVVTLLVGIAFANLLGFTGIFWWAFVIFFYLIISAILGAIGV